MSSSIATHRRGSIPALAAGNRRPLAGYAAKHFAWSVERRRRPRSRSNRPERKNPLTFDSYAELRDLFERAAPRRRREGGRAHRRRRQLLLRRRRARDHRPAGAAEGARAADVHAHDRRPRQGDARLPAADRRRDRRRLRRRRRDHGDGVATCASAPRARKTAFLFNRVGLAGCDMGACAMLPRIVGQGRASELLYTGRALGGEEAERWGFFNRLVAPERLLDEAQALARELAAGPTFANGITKTMLHQEWAMTIEQAIEAEAQAQAICMLTEDFTRAYEAFAAKQKPRLRGRLSMTPIAAPSHLDWPFFEPRHRELRRRARRLGRRAPAARRTATTSTPRAARWCARSATAAGCAMPSPAARTAAPPRRSTRARSAWRARRWRATPAWPTSRSRCRASARARSASPARAQKRALPAAGRARRGDRRVRAVRARGRLRRRRDGAAPRAPTATTTSSTARRPGSPTAASPTSTSCSRAATPTRQGRASGISAFIVDAGTPGFEIAERIDVIAPHPLARLRFAGCRVPQAQRIGADGEGFKVAMRTLDVFRTSVAAAALGFARRALDEALHARDHAHDVRPDASPTCQLTQAKLGADGDDDRRRRAAHLPRRLAARPGRATSRARRRWPSSPPPKARSR